MSLCVGKYCVYSPQSWIPWCLVHQWHRAVHSNNIYSKKEWRRQKIYAQGCPLSVFIIKWGNPQCPFAGGLKLSIPPQNRKHAPPLSIKLLILLLDTLPLLICTWLFKSQLNTSCSRALASPSSTAIFTCPPNLAKCFLFPLLIEQLS